MSNDVIFWTQIVSILTFIGTLFLLYRLLVEGKEATIQTLNSTIQFLKEQLVVEQARVKELKEQGPDELVDALNKRILVTKEELKRLTEDDSSKASEIAQKKLELDGAVKILEHLRSVLVRNELICPDCSAPLARSILIPKDVISNFTGKKEKSYATGRIYLCGARFADGKRETPCVVKPPPSMRDGKQKHA